MYLFEDPRTNWRYVLIVVVLGMVAVGSIFAYQWWVERIELEMTELNVPAKIITNGAERALSVAELLKNPSYDQEVKIYGKVDLLGELFCSCFELSSGRKKVMVWYDTMVEDDGSQRPPVSVAGIKNEDWVVVTGELKESGKYDPLSDFWASNIEKKER